MSRLELSNQATQWKLNVLSFNSPTYSEISSAQVHRMVHHYPIRANQSEIQFSVVFSSEHELENFQRFVRAHQQQVIDDANQLLNLNWPERNIDNWTGVVKTVRAGGQRFNFAPRCDFAVQLVDSMMSRRIGLYTDGLLWQNIYGAGMGPDAVLSPPSDFINNYDYYMYGRDQNGRVNPDLNPQINPAQPGLGPLGIGAGS